MGILQNKVAIITGTAAGIAKQTAIRFAEEGAKIIMCDINEQGLLETEKILLDKGAEVLSLVVDINNFKQLENMVNQGVDKFGTIDILMNSAVGTSSKESAAMPFAQMPIDHLEKHNRVVLSYAYLMQLCYPYMKGKESSIINFSSAMHYGSMQGNPLYLTHGAVPKAAIAGLTRSVADEWGVDGIRVNNVYPSVLTDTLKNSGYGLEHLLPAMARNAFQRPGDPYQDVAGVCLFLAGPDSRFMTGQSLFAEGGAWMGRG